MADPTRRGSLHEDKHEKHRLRVEHDKYTLLIHLSDEDGAGWTTIAIDRKTRQMASAHGPRQADSGPAAYDQLYD